MERHATNMPCSESYRSFLYSHEMRYRSSILVWCGVSATPLPSLYQDLCIKMVSRLGHLQEPLCVEPASNRIIASLAAQDYHLLGAAHIHPLRQLRQKWACMHWGIASFGRPSSGYTLRLYTEVLQTWLYGRSTITRRALQCDCSR